QISAGIDFIPSNDFSFYDQVLDTIAMVGAVPKRFGWSGQHEVDLDTYFGMARGIQRAAETQLVETQSDDAQGAGAPAASVPAMEMTKWFDTNYHYIVPEFWKMMNFKLSSNKALDEYREARLLGIQTRPVLLGPVSFLLLGKVVERDFSALELLDSLLPVYSQVLRQLAEAGAECIQIDEPFLALDLTADQRRAFTHAYETLAYAVCPRIMLTTYFAGLQDNLFLAASLPVSGLHVDLVRAPEQLGDVLRCVPPEMSVSLGVVDGRNVWRTDLPRALAVIKEAAAALGEERVVIAPSCSLQYVPVDLDQETKLDNELRGWLAFARQKIDELALLKRACSQPSDDVTRRLDESRQAVQSRRISPRTYNPALRSRLADITPAMLQRGLPHPQRKQLQQEQIPLPQYPTTTIGSFPQTKEVRARRAAYRRGEITASEYEDYLKQETEKIIRFQEAIGLDVLVHGELERTDMVEYFGEQLTGFAFSEEGWVQSYGSRCVRPPILYGDVTRPHPMTVKWSAYAQSLSGKPVKGMLTGPVTILQWSFVRDDQPRAHTCRQIALAIRDEVQDLEDAGIRMIQIDEPAIREGLPLRESARAEYLVWAVECFKLASSGVEDATQIHTHMCYSEFNDIITAIGQMDADVISIEASRSKMELLDAFRQYQYPNDIGPGVYDIHSPRVPSQPEMTALLESALGVLESGQLWINPDCGLKTRGWEEVEPALRNMVAAARVLRTREPVKG
ncbi:MAG: 5-methyltetrahydropteroyltriglutamate--homocysteine S-methyltransferase, partial [Anaerolineaceae bacterium]